jgi:hypothetical protein
VFQPAARALADRDNQGVVGLFAGISHDDAHGVAGPFIITLGTSILVLSSTVRLGNLLG